MKDGFSIICLLTDAMERSALPIMERELVAHLYEPDQKVISGYENLSAFGFTSEGVKTATRQFFLLQ